MARLQDIGGADIDYLIIGGGAAGCVLASRLSERSDSKVVLVERGRTFEASKEPDQIGDMVSRSLFNPAFMWAGQAHAKGHPDTVGDEGAMPYMAGRVLGGGSSVNGMLVHRGLPGDYDEWAGFGVTGWNWRDVLPYFRKLETDKDIAAPYHGTAGPMPIRRFGRELWSTFEQAVSDGWRQRQLPWMEDLTGEQAVGCGPMPLNTDGGRRVSAAKAYLTPEVRARKNLVIVGDAEAERLLIAGNRVTGAIFAGGRTVLARNVILSAGAFFSPTLLMRSGIGDAAALQARDIAVAADRPGVGANLQDHASLLLAAHLRPSARRKQHLPTCVSFARYSSGIPECHEADMMVTTLGISPGPTRWNPVGHTIASVMPLVHKPYSRGAVRLDAGRNPKIMFNLLSDERDLVRMTQAWRTTRDIVTSGEAGDAITQAFVPLTFGRTDDSIMTALVSTIAAGLLDGPASLRKKLLARVGLPVETIPADGPELTDWVRMCTGPAAHAAGTCRMGRADDREAVVDSDCRVIGVEGLSVVDTSIFPTLMRAGTHIPTIMTAEKAAATMLAAP